ncbi:uncharacterized protein DS421_12g384940 [Arachis hypogaea]|nr:uncharacterized protein DS421_12g384940 [Arachis hypogaea]
MSNCFRYIEGEKIKPELKWMGTRKSTGRRPTSGCCVVGGQARNAAVLLWVATNGVAGGQIGPVGGAGVPLDGAGLLGGVVSTTVRVVVLSARRGWEERSGGAGRKASTTLRGGGRKGFAGWGGAAEDGFTAGLGFLRVRLRVSAESEIERVRD